MASNCIPKFEYGRDNMQMEKKSPCHCNHLENTTEAHSKKWIIPLTKCKLQTQ